MEKKALDSFGKRLAERRKQAGLTQLELSVACGWSTQSRVSNYESAVREPIAADVEKMAAALGTTPSYLLFGDGFQGVREPSAPFEAGNGNVDPLPPPRRIPLVSWVQAGHWTDTEDPYPAGSAERFISTDVRAGRHAYAVEVVGDSMEPDFPEGTILIVDPESAPRHRSFIIVRLPDTNEATFKQLVIEAGKQYLRPLNDAYPVMVMPETAVLCGVVKQARWARDFE